MVYSTCSMSPIEDEAVVSALIKKCEGSIRLVSIDGLLPGLKYEKGVSTWPVYFDGKFHTESNEESKKEPDSEIFFFTKGVTLTRFIYLKKKFSCARVKAFYERFFI